MAIIAMEGFETQNFLTMSPQLKVQSSYVTGTSMFTSDYGSHLRMMTSVGTANRFFYQIGNVATITEWGNYFVFGFRFNPSSLNYHPIIAKIFNDNAGTGPTGDIITLAMDGTGGVLLNGVAQSSGLVFEAGAEYYIELEIDMVSLKARAWLTNQLVGEVGLTGNESGISYLFGWDYVRASSVNLGQVVFGYIDDHYALDGNGSINTTRLGKVKVITRDPQDDATVEFYRSAGTTNASQVAGGTNSGNTSDNTFVYSNEEGASDLYINYDALPFNAPVVAVGVSVMARKAGVDARAVAPMIESGSADAVGERINLLVNSVSAGMSIFDLDPATNDPWSQSSAAALKFGQTLVV